MPPPGKSRRGVRETRSAAGSGANSAPSRGNPHEAGSVKRRKSEKTHIFRYEVHGQSLSESSIATGVMSGL